MHRTICVALVCIGLTAGWLHPLANAQTMTALVLETGGTITPHVEPYQEIASNTQLILHENAWLVFLNYDFCRKVKVIGGTITFNAQTYTITGVKSAEERATCPHKVVLQTGGDVAGTVVRGGLGEPMLHLSTQPTFMLIGPRASDFAQVRVSTTDGRPILIAPLQERRFEWPKEKEPLHANTMYDLTLLPVRTIGATITIRISATALDESAHGSALTFVRVE